MNELEFSLKLLEIFKNKQDLFLRNSSINLQNDDVPIVLNISSKSDDIVYLESLKNKNLIKIIETYKSLNLFIFVKKYYKLLVSNLINDLYQYFEISNDYNIMKIIKSLEYEQKTLKDKSLIFNYDNNNDLNNIIIDLFYKNNINFSKYFKNEFISWFETIKNIKIYNIHEFIYKYIEFYHFLLEYANPVYYYINRNFFLDPFMKTLKFEIIEKAFHPNRYLDWCLDIDEYKEITESFL